MTKLYLYNEDGSLMFCKNISITNDSLSKIEDFGFASAKTLKKRMSNIIKNTRTVTNRERQKNTDYHRAKQVKIQPSGAQQ